MHGTISQLPAVQESVNKAAVRTNDKRQLGDFKLKIAKTGKNNRLAIATRYSIQVVTPNCGTPWRSEI